MPENVNFSGHNHHHGHYPHYRPADVSACPPQQMDSAKCINLGPASNDSVPRRKLA
jgi:hypothetical protein